MYKWKIVKVEKGIGKVFCETQKKVFKFFTSLLLPYFTFFLHNTAKNTEKSIDCERKMNALCDWNLQVLENVQKWKLEKLTSFDRTEKKETMNQVLWTQECSRGEKNQPETLFFSGEMTRWSTKTYTHAGCLREMYEEKSNHLITRKKSSGPEEEKNEVTVKKFNLLAQVPLSPVLR